MDTTGTMGVLQILNNDGKPQLTSGAPNPMLGTFIKTQEQSETTVDIS